MARSGGKHAANSKRDFDFSDTNYERKRDRYKEDEEQVNDRFNVDNSSYSEPSYTNQNEEEYDDYDEEESLNYKKIAIVVVAVIAVILIGVFVFKKVSTKEVAPETKNETTESQTMPSVVEGYTVIGKIVIKDIDVDQYIFNTKEERALEKGITKFYGPGLNSYGNVVLIGHNYKDKFERLSELDVGDTFVIIDKKMQETTYKITEIYSVEPDDLQCLLQNNEKVEITLVTCESGSTKRLIVKAEEKSETANASETNENG